MKKTIICFITIGILILIIVGSFIPKLPSGNESLFHVIAYFVLSLLILGILIRKYPLLNAIIFTFFILLFLGISIEVVQIFVPVRAFEFMDLLSNLAGIFLGTICFYFFIKIVKSDKT